MNFCKCRVGLKLFYFDQFFSGWKCYTLGSSCKRNDECWYLSVHMYNIVMIEIAFTVLLCQLQLYLIKNIDYNRLACEIVIANLGGPDKRKLKWKERKVRKLF